jgi:phospholipase/carboxylesterase
MIDLSKLGLNGQNLSFLPPALLGRLSFRHIPPSQPALPSGHHRLGLSVERDTMLFVPDGLDLGAPIPLLVTFHGASGHAESMLSFFEDYANKHKFLLLVPQSTFVTWDLSIGGHGPDLERLNKALAEVASRFPITNEHFGLAGFSDGASYALSVGVSNGDLISHVIVLSGGFMNAYQPIGKPRLFIAHSPKDEQLPIDKSGRKHATLLINAGYEVNYLEFDGAHTIDPVVVEKAVNFFLANRAK